MVSYWKNGRYIPGDEMPESKKLQKERKNDVEFYQIESLFRATTFTSCKLQVLSALRNEKYGEEIFADFGTNYKFN